MFKGPKVCSDSVELGDCSYSDQSPLASYRIGSGVQEVFFFFFFCIYHVGAAELLYILGLLLQNDKNIIGHFQGNQILADQDFCFSKCAFYKILTLFNQKMRIVFYLF